MPRIRSVKPEYWLDRKLAKGASRDARLLYIGLWNYADEHARLHGDPAVIKGQVFPYDDDIDLAVIDLLLGELAALGRVQRYEFEGDPYLFLPKLAKHQRLEAAKVESRLPPPPQTAGKAPLPPNVPSSQAVSESRADESAPRSESSEPIVVQQVAGSRGQVAGGREHVAGCMPQQHVGSAQIGANSPLQPQIEELQTAMSRAGVTVAWDAPPEGMSTIAAAVDRCGIQALVKNATARHQPANPAFSVKAFVPGWAALPAKAQPLALVVEPCEKHGDPNRSRCPMCRSERSSA